jgi:uncharacterized protein YndB with AHSA1/START domain
VVTGEYREIVPSQRIVMTWVYDGPMGSAEKMEALLTGTSAGMAQLPKWNCITIT